MIDFSLVKQHLRVLHTREDVIIQLYIDAAIGRFSDYADRDLYESDTDRQAVQDEIDADQAALDSLIASGADPDVVTEQQAGIDYRQSRLTDSVIIDEQIIYGALLLIGSMYSTRDMDAALPRAVEAFWQPKKLYRIA